MDILWTLLIIVICLLTEGFFSGSEMGVVSADKMELRRQAAKGSHGAKRALKMLENPEWLLATTLVGTNISVVTNTTIATALMIQLFGEKGDLLTVLLIAPLIWIFGEIIPKSIFQQRANSITPRTIIFLQIASYLFFPLLLIFTTITHLLTKATGYQPQSPFTLREEITMMLQMPAEEGDIEPEEATMINRIFNFSATTAYEVMVPLIDVTAVELGMSCGQAIGIAVEDAHIRLPVYDERVDQVVGVLNTLELLGEEADQPIKPYVNPVRYVPSSCGIKDLLLDLRKDGDMVAVVVDEFGGAEGLVTIEDIVEEVVEEIEDEYDSQEQSQQWIRKISEKEYVVSARLELDTLEYELGIELPKGNYATLAGFLLEKAREIPPNGTIIEADHISYIILHSTPQAIQEVRIRW